MRCPGQTARAYLLIETLSRFLVEQRNARFRVVKPEIPIYHECFLALLGLEDAPVGCTLELSVGTAFQMWKSSFEYSRSFRVACGKRASVSDIRRRRQVHPRESISDALPLPPGQETGSWARVELGD